MSNPQPEQLRFYACAAYVLHHALRTETLRGTEFERAQPARIINRLFKVAVRVVQYNDRIRLRLPTTCPVKPVLKKMTEILYLVPPMVRDRAEITSQNWRPDLG
jgi:hypothetical protein